MIWYLNAFRNYANFEDRASRTDYWMFGLFNIVFAIIAYSIDLIFNLSFEKMGFGPFYILYALVAFIPGLAVATRRLHDVGKSGWYLFLALIPIIGAIWLIVLFATDSEPEENFYGENPKESPVAPFINDETSNTKIIVASVIWLFINRLFWAVISKYSEEFYSSSYYRYFNEINILIWAFFPLFLSLAVKNYKWKIALLLLSTIYMMYNFIELVKIHLATQNHFQF